MEIRNFLFSGTLTQKTWDSNPNFTDLIFRFKVSSLFFQERGPDLQLDQWKFLFTTNVILHDWTLICSVWLNDSYNNVATIFADKVCLHDNTKYSNEVSSRIRSKRIFRIGWFISIRFRTSITFLQQCV